MVAKEIIVKVSARANKALRQDVVDTFKEYGGWWRLSGMAEWLGGYAQNVSEDELKLVWDELEREGLMDRKTKASSDG